MNIESTLHRNDKKQYGNNYDIHYLEQYKMYIEMTDRISNRRQSANSFFLTVNTAVVAIIGYVQLGEVAGKSQAFYWLVSIAGMLLCYSWYRLIRSYKDLNTGKFAVIHALEKKLPTAPYDAEWESLGGGKNPKLFLPFTEVEIIVPWIFLLIHLFVFLQNIPWNHLICYFFNG